MSAHRHGHHQRPGSRRGDGLLLVSALCAAGFTVFMLYPILQLGTALWWTLAGCGAFATATAALGRRTPRRISAWLALLTTLPLACVALIFALVPPGWLAATGMMTAIGAAVTHARRA